MARKIILLLTLTILLYSGCSDGNGELKSIAVTRLPDLKAHAAGAINSVAQLDLDGLEVTGTYGDGSKRMETITTADLSTGDNLAALGPKTIVVSIQGKTASFTITVKQGLDAALITSASDIYGYILTNCGGGTAANPKALTIIGRMTIEQIKYVIAAVNVAGTYVILDLADVVGLNNTMSDFGRLLTDTYGITGKERVKGILFPETLTVIDNISFYYCTNITSIRLPDSITTIGKNAFARCTNLANVTLAGCDNLVLDSFVFYSCPNLSFTTSGGTWTTIFNEKALIRNDNTLAAYPSASGVVDLSSFIKITAIGDSVFAGSNLTQIVFPAGLKTIGEEVFSGCGLVNVIFPGSLISIGARAFIHCSALTEIVAKPIIPPILGEDVFNNNISLTMIKVPAVSVIPYKLANGWASYADKIVAE